MRAALFIPCFIDQLHPEVGIAMVQVLQRVGVEVCFPPAQTCCGQPAFNTGYWDQARELAVRYCEIFAGYDAVVSPSGSCVAMVRRYYPELLGAAAGPLPANWRRTAANTFEFTEFLVHQLGRTDLGARFPHKVTYHDGCHALRELGLKQTPRQLLRAVRELELLEMTEAETCCGFGGTFAVKLPAVSFAMDEVKCQSILASGAEVVCSTDTSCLMQIGGYLRRHRLPIQTRHIAEVLACT